MSDAGFAADVHGGARERETELASLRDAARHMGVHRLRDGSWFRRIVVAHVKKHQRTIEPGHWDRRYPGFVVEARASRQIAAAARKAASAGALASVGASAGGLLSLMSEGLAAPVGVPAAALSMTLEAGYTALLQVDLACDLASIYGVPFDADDVGEVAALFGLALEVELKEKPRKRDGGNGADEPRGLTARLQELETGDVATHIGRKMLEDAVVKHVVPFVGLAISARWNYVATRKLGATVKRYIRYRCALRHTLARLRLDGVTDPALLVEGAWLLATVDGDIQHEEVMAIALITQALPDDARAALELDKALGDDEEQWFDDLARVPAAMHDPLLDVLYLIAAADRETHESERRFLRRVGRALGRPIAFDRIAAISAHLAHGDELPPGFLHCL